MPRSKRRKDFVERTLQSLLGALEQALYAEELAKKPGLLQGLDPRVNVVGLLSLIVAAAMAQNLAVIGGIFGLTVVLAVLSQVPIRTLAVREWIGVLIFSGLIALPALFITPGQSVYQLPVLGWNVTAQGLKSALYLISRTETAATLALLLILCTSWTQVLKALRVLHVPVVFVVILGMTHRYIFLLLQTAQDLFEARRSRLVGRLDGASQRRLSAASAGVLLSKSLHLSNEVFLAMQSRGFRGEVYTLDEFEMRRKDWLALLMFLSAAGLALFLGHL